MQKLIIIRGNSGSGKSTVAKRLRREMGYETMLIPQDTVRRDILRVKDISNNPSRELIGEIALFGKRIGYDVIIEGILSTKRYKDILLKLANEFDEAYVYYFDIPFEETLRRHTTKPNAHEFGEAEMREWWHEKDYLGVANEHIFLAEESEDAIVRHILHDIGRST